LAIVLGEHGLAPLLRLLREREREVRARHVAADAERARQRADRRAALARLGPRQPRERANDGAERPGLGPVRETHQVRLVDQRPPGWHAASPAHWSLRSRASASVTSSPAARANASIATGRAPSPARSRASGSSARAGSGPIAASTSPASAQTRAPVRSRP